MFKTIKMIAVILVAVLATGCATNPGVFTTPDNTSTGYKVGQSPQTVRIGTVLAVRNIQLTHQEASLAQKVGGTLGALTGAVLGNKVATRSDKRASAAVLGGLGGLIGAEAGKQTAGRVPGQEIVIRFDDSDKTVAIAQSSADGIRFKKGEKVMIVGNGRVAPLN